MSQNSCSCDGHYCSSCDGHYRDGHRSRCKWVAIYTDKKNESHHTCSRVTWLIYIYGDGHRVYLLRAVDINESRHSWACVTCPVFIRMYVGVYIYIVSASPSFWKIGTRVRNSHSLERLLFIYVTWVIHIYDMSHSSLTEEIRLVTFGSPDLSVFL